MDGNTVDSTRVQPLEQETAPCEPVRDNFSNDPGTPVGQIGRQDHASEPAPQHDPKEVLELKVQDSRSNNELHFKLKITTRMKKLMDAVCKTWGYSRATCRFLFDGGTILDTHTPASLKLEDGDMIEVHQEQRGGDSNDEFDLISKTPQNVCPRKLKVSVHNDYEDEELSFLLTPKPPMKKDDYPRSVS
jgi:small ubiquitin-related modifier